MIDHDERFERAAAGALRDVMRRLAVLFAIGAAAVGIGGFVAAGGDLADGAARHHLAAVGLAVMAARAADLSRDE